jgi:hypothetical protein
MGKLRNKEYKEHKVYKIYKDSKLRLNYVVTR